MTGLIHLRNILLFIICMLLGGYTVTANSAVLKCGNSANGQTSSPGASATIKVEIDIHSLDQNSLDILLTDMAGYAWCSGEPNVTFKDAVRANSFTLSSAMTGLGFTGYLISNGGAKMPAPSYVCIWLDGNCSTTGSWSGTAPLKVKVGMERVANSGNWATGVTLSAGTEIARMVSEFHASGMGGWGWPFVWSFVLKNDLIITTKTCSLNQYDNTVALPSVSRNAITGHGTGRYPGAQKEFIINLACDPQTKVSVTFEGDMLNGTGSDSVLKNSIAGNDNIGVQLLFNNNSPIKMAEKLLLTASSQTTELLSFNAYYYYKGGAVSGGPVKANATFTFDYQ